MAGKLTGAVAKTYVLAITLRSFESQHSPRVEHHLTTARKRHYAVHG